ncbi:MAG TPA: TIR domain-containing protein [Pyrinomonadaceae bacterium]|nr:TIR domain-containing protein [Pyrinomonadaceae bacterium]
MRRKKFDVFLSHNSIDEPWVNRLKVALQERGVKVWLDKDEIRPGARFVRAIEIGLEESKAVALIVSPEAMASGWVEEEYDRALSLAQSKDRPLQLIPVILREAEMPGFLGNRNYVDFRDETSFDEKIEKLIYGITGKKSANQVKRIKPDPGLFDIPVFPDQVPRPSLLSRIRSLVESNPLVSVEGLPGSGKTYLVASFLKEKKPHLMYDSILWYDTYEKETLNDLLALIETQISLVGLAIVSKCKELIHILRERNVLLVIDDFHQVDQTSYSTLINIASGSGDKARIILISRTYVDLVRSAPRIGHLEITGFAFEEMSRFLASRGFKNINHLTINDLIAKTDGLPLAASLFTTLVLDFGRHPDDLLSGNMINTVRLRNWFDEVLSLIGEKESRLLHVLSVCDGPFNIGVIRKLCNYEKIGSAEQVFENLQRTYLIQKYSPYRWNVHQLIAMFCLSALDVKDRKRINLTLARHYLAGFSIRVPRILDEEEFFWKIRACKQFQLAKEFKESEKILHDVSKTINFRGHYELFIQLSTNELQNNHDRDSWIDYHHAHFCLITGKIKQSLHVIEPLLYNTTDRNANKRLSFARLYAEILGAMGKPQLALQKLRGVMSAIDSALAKVIVLSQARTTEVWLLTKLEKYREAKELCESLLVESTQRDDKLGGAIALTHGGIISRLTGDTQLGFEKLNDAVALFKEGENRRGFAWGLLNLSLSQFDVDDRSRAIYNLKESLRIYSDIGECSIDYLQSLRAVKLKQLNPKVTQIINSEIRRVTTALNDLLQDTRT